MKLYFTGSDVQLLNEFPKQLPIRKLPYVLFYRLVIRLAMRFAEEYWIVHKHLIPELNRFGITKNIKVVQHDYDYNKKLPEKKHEGFNILYYCPTGKDNDWTQWIYGYEMFKRVKDYYAKYPEVNFIETNGNHDMNEVFPITDFLLRCNNHDGGARMVDECKAQDIPYYWSWESPNFIDIIDTIENARTRRHLNRNNLSMDRGTETGCIPSQDNNGLFQG